SVSVVNLPSFPTRRSSDLSAGPAVRFPESHLLRLACVLLVLDVFLPELFLELRIGLLFRRAPQTARDDVVIAPIGNRAARGAGRSEEHTSELQSRENLVCR